MTLKNVNTVIPCGWAVLFYFIFLKAPKPFMRSSSVSSPMVMRVNKEDTTK